MLGVGIGVWISAAITVILILGLTIWVTNKAYSRKWEDDEPSDHTTHSDK